MDSLLVILVVCSVIAVLIVLASRRRPRKRHPNNGLHQEVHMMWGVLAVSLLFLYGAIHNLVKQQPDLGNAITSMSIAAVLIGLFFYLRSQHRSTTEFEAWLLSNADAIRGSGARYQEIAITAKTTLVRYQAVLSFLIVTFKFPTRYYIAEREATGIAWSMSTLASLLLGWWGVPWGPIYTAMALISNARGGLRQTAGERLTQLEFHRRDGSRSAT